MSVISQISNELSSLVTESRRRNSEIKHASERSLAILKTYQPSVSEAVFMRDLSQNADFITPFLLSCSTRNAKFSALAIPSLQKLIQAHSIPISKLDLLLEALTESTHLAIDIQLKVLQILPILFQNYASFINGDLIPKTLMICSILQNPNKVPTVINTAAATEQQLFLSLFEKLNEDGNDQKEYEVRIDDDKALQVTSNSFDAYRVLSDLCILIEKQKPDFLPFKTLSESFGFELLENLLLNYTDIFKTHVELGYLIRTKVVPLLLRCFSSHKEFGIVVRVSRLILLLIKNLLEILEIEAEVMLSLLTHVISKDSNLPKWKRILSLEIFQGILGDFILTKRIYGVYDYDESKKNVVTDFFNVCLKIIREDNVAQEVLKISEIVSVPSSSHAISQQNSSPRVPFLEQLDKPEIPVASESYILLLILTSFNYISDGIGNFALEKTTTKDNKFSFLTNLSSEEQEDIEVKQLQHLIVSNAKSFVSIGTEFLYSSISNELFHVLIRSLQKLCHASGVLGLVNQRDSLLLLFSIAIVSNVSRKSTSKNSSIGGSLVETISATITAFPSPSTPNKGERIHPRSLNSRHVICFRALSSLTISLGPRLQKSWKFVLITFQWFDYFLNGPSEYLSNREAPPKPDLSPADIKSLESSTLKLYESTKNYDSEEYQELVQELLQLAKSSNFEEQSDGLIDNEPISDDKFKICCYNKEFFTNRIGEISKLNASRYVQGDSRDLTFITGFLSDVVVSPDVIPDLRITACFTVNGLLREIGKEGFSNVDESSDTTSLEARLFNSLSDLIDKMLDSHSKDQKFSHVESQMFEETLKTLFELLDRFGTFFNNSWDIILHIINSVFKFFEISEFKTSSQTKLLKSSFEILQFILNDFLQAIPLQSLRFTVDVLENFCTQETELNVSFSAVSYYWLISDHIRQQVSGGDKAEFVVLSYDDLLPLINKGTDRDIRLHSLWLYLLNSLIKVSNDPRAEVKNGAIQTFFRIVDSHGSYLDWNKTFNVVVKDLLNIEIFKPDTKEEYELKPFKESVLIILKGVTDLYARFFLSSREKAYWTELLKFYERLAQMEVIEISTSLYKSYHHILDSFTDLDSEIFENFFNFWSHQQIKYVSLESDAYQGSLVELISSFSALNRLSILSKSQVEISLSTFNNAIRFPFLPRSVSDLDKPTRLQTTVLDCLKMLDVNLYGDAVIQNLSSLVLLPFQTRSRILKKLNNTNREIPTFIAISGEITNLLEKELENAQDIQQYIRDKTVVKVFRNLIDSITFMRDDDEQSKRILNAELWKKSITLLSNLAVRIFDKSDLSDDSSEAAVSIWRLVIELICSTFPGKNDNRDEGFNIESYIYLRDLILKHIDDSPLYAEGVKFLVESLWKASFLYDNDEVEEYLFKTSDDPTTVTQQLLEAQLDSYSTKRITPLSQQKFRLICLEDLFNFAERLDERNSILAGITLPFLLCRLVLTIKDSLALKSLLISHQFQQFSKLNSDSH